MIFEVYNGYLAIVPKYMIYYLYTCTLLYNIIQLLEIGNSRFLI